MHSQTAVAADYKQSPEEIITSDGQLLSQHLQALREAMYPPDAQKTLRRFLTGEVAKLLGMSEQSLRDLHTAGHAPEPGRLENNYRAYTLEQVNELRRVCAALRPSDAVRLDPHRRGAEHLQIIGFVNFKGGSAKTTSALHLAHHLALHGYRVLAIDLDPQASLSAMFGVQPELEVGERETIYAALTYDSPRPLRDVIRPTYFTGIDLVPGNTEIMEYEHETPLALRQAQSGGPFYERLRNAIDSVEGDYDVVILDTPPQLGFLSLSAVYAATGLVVTVHPAMLDLMSMNQYLEMLGNYVKVLNEDRGALDLEFFQYLITRHDGQDSSQIKVVTLLRHLYGDRVFASAVAESSAVETAGLAKRSVYELEARDIGRDTLRRARESLDGVNSEMCALINRCWGR